MNSIAVMWLAPYIDIPGPKALGYKIVNVYDTFSALTRSINKDILSSESETGQEPAVGLIGSGFARPFYFYKHILWGSKTPLMT